MFASLAASDGATRIMSSTPVAILVGAVLIAAAILIVFRWEIASPGVMRLDRWTGKIVLCNRMRPVLPRFLSNQVNHFMPFWRFEKFGYGHLSAARFQLNDITDFERHCPLPELQQGVGDLHPFAHEFGSQLIRE
jgi:hypothetical protein